MIITFLQNSIDRKKLLVAVGILAATGIVSGPVRAQSKTAITAPKFEVASIRPCAPGAAVRGSVNAAGGRLQVTCISAYNLASIAYGVGFRFPLKERGPEWIKIDRYSIEATAADNPEASIMQGPMLQALLEDRFKLKIARESREVPVYTLTEAKGGFKLKALMPGSCVTLDPLKPPANLADLKAAAAAACATANTIGLRKLPTGRVTADFHGISVDDFSKALDRAMDRPILNRTGIAGIFDIRMEFAPDDAVPAFMPGGRLLGFAGPPNPPAQGDPVAGPSIFTAVQEQLGLKLESTKGPGEFFSIEHVERPSEN
jgi:uncharacterized protein (TIGR03435 family)